MIPLFFLLLLGPWCLPAWSTPSASPHVLLVLPSEKHFPQADRRLAEQLQIELRRCPRFSLLPLPDPGGESQATELAKSSGATAILLIDFQENPEATYIRLTDVKGEYRTRCQAEIQLLEMPNMRPRRRQIVPCRGEHAYARNVAEDEAFKQLGHDVRDALFSAFPLETRLSSRTGYHVQLGAGAEQGLAVGMLFAQKTDHGPQGLLHVTRVEKDAAEGSIYLGYDTFQPEDTLIEQVYGSLPAALGIVSYQLRGGAANFMGIALERNHSGLGWGQKLEFGSYEQGNIKGPALYAALVSQFALVPERAWLNLDLGLGGELLKAMPAGTPDLPTTFGLHGLVGSDLVMRLPPLSLSFGLSYLSPWRANSGSDTPMLGGWGLRASLNWQI